MTKRLALLGIAIAMLVGGAYLAVDGDSADSASSGKRAAAVAPSTPDRTPLAQINDTDVDATRQSPERAPIEVADAKTGDDSLHVASTISIFVDHRFGLSGRPRNLRVVARSAGGVDFKARRIKASSQMHVVSGVPAGEYTVEITSEKHQPWTMSGVKPGNFLRASLVGNSRLQLTVVDGSSFEPIDQYRARIRFRGTDWHQRAYVIHEPSDAVPPSGLFDGLVKGNVTLSVEAVGYASAQVSLGRIKSGTTATAVIRLFHGGAVNARAVSANGEPAPNAKIVLSPVLEAANRGRISWAASQLRKFHGHDQLASEDGLAKFTLVPEGRHRLFASVGSLKVTSDEFTVANGELTSVELRLPAAGTLRGQLTGGAEGAFEGLLVRALDETDLDANPFGKTGIAVVQRDGSFAIEEELKATEYRVLLEIPDHMTASGPTDSHRARGRRRTLGTVVLRADVATEVTFDAADSIPGRIRFGATINGNVASDVTVRIWSRAGTTEDVTLDADGEGSAGVLFPGEFETTAYPLDRQWKYSHGSQVTLQPGGDVRVDLDIVTGRGRVRILDAATSGPAANATLFIDGRQPFTTDADGRAELELTPGDYVLTTKRTSRSGDADGTTLTWGAEGSSTPELTVGF